MSKRKKSDVKTKLLAGAGASLIAAGAKQSLAIDAHGGYAAKFQKKLEGVKVPKGLSYHIAGLAKRLPVAALGSTAAIATYDILGKDRKDLSTSAKLRNALIGGGVSAAISYPLSLNTAKFPTEFGKLKGGNRAFLVAKSRLLQSLAGAPAGILTFELLKDKLKIKDETTKSIVAGLGGATAGAIATLPMTVKYEKLIPKVDEKIAPLAKKLGKKIPALKIRATSGVTFGTQVARMLHSAGPRIGSALLGAGASYAAYDILKKKLQKSKK